MSGYIRFYVNCFVGNLGKREKKEVGRRKRQRRGKRSSNNLKIEVEKGNETREKATAVCVLLAQDDYSSQVTQFWRALRKTVRNIIIKNTREIIHFKKNQSNTNARCKYTL